MEPDLFAQNAAYYDQVADRYDAELTGNPQDVLARAAFRDLVARYVPPGSIVLDFGCGTGLDAHFYAQRGYRVLACDHSPRMMDQLKLRCAAEIATARVEPYLADYSSFLETFAQLPAPHAVVANFAVLNSIRDLEPLFDAFARHLAPPGWIIVSILNPIHWSQWRNACIPQPCMTYFHPVPAVLRAANRFHLVGRANAGTFVRYDSQKRERLWWGRADSTRKRIHRVLWATSARKLLGHFVFLVLRRDP